MTIVFTGLQKQRRHNILPRRVTDKLADLGVASITLVSVSEKGVCSSATTPKAQPPFSDSLQANADEAAFSQNHLSSSLLDLSQVRKAFSSWLVPDSGRRKVLIDGRSAATYE